MTAGREQGAAATGTSAAPDPAESGPIELGAGESGEIRAAVEQVVADQRQDGGRSSVWQLRAALAVRQADVVDRASVAGDGPAYDRASARLLAMLDALTALEVPAGGARDDGDDAGADDNVRELFTGGPTLGHASHA